MGMLILSRRVGETILLGTNVKITVLGVNGHQVRIGVDAPKDVGVVREEITDRYPVSGAVEPGRQDERA